MACIRYTGRLVVGCARCSSAGLLLMRNRCLLNGSRTCSRLYSTDERETMYGSLTRNLRLMKEEVVTKIKSPNLDTMFDRSRVFWRYKDAESLKEFRVFTDETIGGNSTAELGVSRHNKLLFTGSLNTDVPRDGETVRSGFCTLQMIPKYGSFNRKVEHDLSAFNLLHLKLKGDGRAYMINIYTNSYFSLTHDDIWSYFLFTRGGPYWQNVSIPFSKFFLSSLGRVQDRQCPLDAERVVGVGLTLADAVNGEFYLELDSISLSYDATESEEFVYEAYREY